MSGGALRNGADRALAIIRTLPRVALDNIRGNRVRHKESGHRGQHGGKLHGYPHKGGGQKLRIMRLGFEGTRKAPFYLRIPVENYYKDHHLRRQYKPISLLQLQTLIDTNRLDSNEPIDLSSLCNTQILYFDILKRHYGFQLTDEGLDNFKAQINIEVQWAPERVIAAVEKNGGRITCSFYDIDALWAARDPQAFFKKGQPIPRRMLPPEDAIEYYSDPKNRGYLADPEAVCAQRLVLAQKYGYELPDLSLDPKREMLLRSKDPRQIFYGLRPGWVVSLRDKCILKPKSKELEDYYYT